MSEIIKCIGRRRLIVYRDKQNDQNIDLEILLRNKHLATLVLEPKEAQKLLSELNRVVAGANG